MAEAGGDIDGVGIGEIEDERDVEPAADTLGTAR
jgi:hypothetical protein